MPAGLGTQKVKMGKVKLVVEMNLLMSFQGQLCGNAVENMQAQVQNMELQATGKR